MWILKINMSDKTYKLEDVPNAYKNLGGRGLTSTIVCDEVNPLCHPLGPNNVLVFAPGIVTGTDAPTSARVSVGAKSPLTGGIKESNAGTSWSVDVARMKIKAIVVYGQPKEDKYWMIHISWDAKEERPKIEFLPADEYIGSDLYAVFPKIYERFGKGISIAGIGVAGEYGYANSGIVFNDLKGQPTRYSGRGGLGSVMGSKRLKFIVTSAQGAPEVPIVDKALFDQGCEKLANALRTHDITKPKGGLNTYGTAVLINILNEAGGFQRAISKQVALRERLRLPVRQYLKEIRLVLEKKFTIMPVAQVASYSALIHGTSKMEESTSPVSSMSRIGLWALTWALTTWTKLQRWYGYATPMDWTLLRRVTLLVWLQKRVSSNLVTEKRP